jgi:uncharacterized membrane protein YhaH (DUF805 family)
MNFIVSQLSPQGYASRAKYAISLLLVLAVSSSPDIFLVLRAMDFDGFDDVHEISRYISILGVVALVFLAHVRRLAGIGLPRWGSLVTAGLPTLLIVRQSYLALAAHPSPGALKVVATTSVPEPSAGFMVSYLIFNHPELVLVLSSVLLLLPPTRGSKLPTG